MNIMPLLQVGQRIKTPLVLPIVIFIWYTFFNTCQGSHCCTVLQIYCMISATCSVVFFIQFFRKNGKMSQLLVGKCSHQLCDNFGRGRFKNGDNPFWGLEGIHFFLSLLILRKQFTVVIIILPLQHCIQSISSSHGLPLFLLQVVQLVCP